MSIATQQKLTLAEYLTYDDGTDARHELVDGVLVEMGAENPLNPQIAIFLLFAFADLGFPRSQLVIGHQIQVNSSHASARQPDLIVHSPESDAAITLEKILPLDVPPPYLVVEVVSNGKDDKQSRDRDHIEKVIEYADRGIPEYWIIDPDQALVKIGRLIQSHYQFQIFTGTALVRSLTFPTLSLTAEQILSAGR